MSICQRKEDEVITKGGKSGAWVVELQSPLLGICNDDIRKFKTSDKIFENILKTAEFKISNVVYKYEMQDNSER